MVAAIRDPGMCRVDAAYRWKSGGDERKPGCDEPIPDVMSCPRVETVARSDARFTDPGASSPILDAGGGFAHLFFDDPRDEHTSTPALVEGRLLPSAVPEGADTTEVLTGVGRVIVDLAHLRKTRCPARHGGGAGRSR